MKLNVLEKGKGKLRVEVDGESATLLNLLREKAWEAGATQSSYAKKHPYISQPELLVLADDPAKTLAGAAQMVINDAKEFGRQFERAAKK